MPPERVLHAAHDFSDQREDVFPAVSDQAEDVHEMGQTSADVTEGTRAGPIVNWERCRYDWSTPGRVIATVDRLKRLRESRKQVGDHSHARTRDGGSHVEMTLTREFKHGPRGRFFGTLFGLVGNRIFRGYALTTIKNIEHLERTDEPTSLCGRRALRATTRVQLRLRARMTHFANSTNAHLHSEQPASKI